MVGAGSYAARASLMLMGWGPDFDFSGTLESQNGHDIVSIAVPMESVPCWPWNCLDMYVWE